MQVFKFGGASVKDATSIMNVAKIIQQHSDSALVIVISAMGKSTNELENILKAFIASASNKDDLLTQFIDKHRSILLELVGQGMDVPAYDKCISDLTSVLAQINSYSDYNFSYDQVVSYGELISTAIVSLYLKSISIGNSLIDIRTIFKSNNRYREAQLDLKTSTTLIKSITKEQTSSIIITQGFIASDFKGNTTTLGREGSDYSAAILAVVLGADKLTIWKDVDGVLNADPRIKEGAILIPELSYAETIEMTHCGAKIIHPKTLQPLYAANIPLCVRSFKNQENKGTIISSSRRGINYPEIFIEKENQLLISISTKDLTFMNPRQIARLYGLFKEFHVKLSISQMTATSFSFGTDNVPYKLDPLIEAVKNYFECEVKDDLTLYTIRHYLDETKQQYINKHDLVLLQIQDHVLQALLKA